MKNLKKEFLTKFIIGAVLLSGIVIVFNMIWNNLQIGRFDLTAEQVYKLSLGHCARWSNSDRGSWCN